MLHSEYPRHPWVDSYRLYRRERKRLDRRDLERRLRDPPIPCALLADLHDMYLR